jgi:hypothetical protein
MKAIWINDEPAYHGEHVDSDAIWSWPKPIQRPHPPVLVGGNGEVGVLGEEQRLEARSSTKRAIVAGSAVHSVGKIATPKRTRGSLHGPGPSRARLRV